MKTLISKAVAIGMIAAAITGCRKDDTQTNNQDAAKFKTEFSNLVAANQPQKHTFTVSANAGGTIVGNNTRVMFYPGAFITTNGTSITGNVQVELSEIHTKAQMVLANKPTISPDGLLMSSGEAYVNATQNGQQLRLRQGYSIIQFNGNSFSQPMNLFRGTIDANNFNAVSWDLVPSVSTTNANIDCANDSMGTVVYVNNNNGIPTCDTLYTFPLDSFGWMNCDYFMNQSYTNLTPVTLNVPEGYDETNTVVYVVFSSLNIVTSAHYDNTIQAFAINNGYQVPIGMQATVVALRYMNNEFWSAIQPVTFSANHTETLTFTQTTVAEYTAAVTALN